MQVALGMMSIFTGLLSGGAQKSAYEESAQQSKEMAARNAARIEAETMETARQQREEQARETALAKAAAAGSGVDVRSTTAQDYGASLFEARQKEIDWTLRSGRSRADIALQEGAGQARIAESEGKSAWWGSVSQGIGGLTSLF